MILVTVNSILNQIVLKPHIVVTVIGTQKIAVDVDTNLGGIITD